MNCRSDMPIWLVQKPVAVRSRKLVKNARPCEGGSGSGRRGAGHETSSRTAARSASVQATNILSERRSHSRSSQASPPRIATWRARLGQLRSSHHEVHELGHAGLGGAARSLVPGRMTSTSTRTVSYSCAVKNFGVNGAAGLRRGLRRLRETVRRGRLGLGPGKPGGHGRGREQPQHRTTLAALIAPPPSAGRRCTRWSSSPAPGSSRSRSCRRW